MSLFGADKIREYGTVCAACGTALRITVPVNQSATGQCTCGYGVWVCDPSGRVSWSYGTPLATWPSSYSQQQVLLQQRAAQLLSNPNYLSAYPNKPLITTTMPDHLKDMPEMQETLIGYRAYKLLYTTDKHGIELSGARAAWPEREFTAKCNSLDIKIHPEELCRIHLADPKSLCGADNHGCGIYAMRKSQSIDYVRLESYRVIGECSLYGWVAPHTKGFRAEKARIERLTYLHYGSVLADDKVIAKKLHERYGVPVELQSFEGWQNSG